MLHVDLDAREVFASVRDLAHASEEVASADGPLGMARALLGSEVHHRYRVRREAKVQGFTAEVPVSGVQQVDDFTAHLTGRIDGVIEADDHLLVEEVKSLTVTAGALAALRPEDLPDAALQLRLYALLLARTRPGTQVHARLVLVSVLEEAEREIDVSLQPARTEQMLIRRLRRIVAAAESRAQRAHRHAAGDQALCFPYPEPRPHQQEMADHVHDCLAAERPALVEAPTGIGKTIAALLPALRFARAHDALLYFLTAKRTQRARVAETFEDLVAAAGADAGPLRALTLRARADMCPPGTLLCHPQHCTHLANLRDPERTDEALDELLSGPPHIAPQTVFEVGRQRELCPHVLSSLLCARVDLAIGDYNHVYAPALPPGQFPGELLPRPVVVVVDEAHNLFDRAREYDSPFLARRDVAAVLRSLQQEDGALDEALAHHVADVLGRIDDVMAEATALGDAFPDGCRPMVRDPARWEPLAARGAALMMPYVQRQQSRGLVRPDDPVLRVLHGVSRLRDLLGSEDPVLVPYAACGDGAPHGPGVGVYCVDPSARLRSRHAEVMGTVAMSATLTPLEHYRAVLGFDSLDARGVVYGSPFPVEQRCLAIVPTVSTTWRARKRHYGQIARTIEQVVAVRPGHYVAYFPSFAFLEAVRARLSDAAPALLVQTPRMTDAAREALLARLVGDPAPLLLLAAAGGIFAEGIDLPGDALIGAIVVGPALPKVGLERAAMRHHFDESSGDGFARAMVVPGMQRVVQAAGRVHRTPEDRGAIVLLGRRFAQSPYAECLPEHWSRYGIEEAVTDDPVSRLEAFWHGGRRTTWTEAAVPTHTASDRASSGRLS